MSSEAITKEWSKEEVWTKAEAASFSAEVNKYCVGRQLVDKDTGELLMIHPDPECTIAHFCCLYTYEGAVKVIKVPIGGEQWTVIYKNGIWAELINENKLLE